MSMNPMMPDLGPGPDLMDYPITTCECGCQAWIPAVMMREIPGVILGDASVETATIPFMKTYVCAACHKQLQADVDMLAKEQEKHEQAKGLNPNNFNGNTTTESGLIL